jgi:tRNA pseudouridine55 synthase
MNIVVNLNKERGITSQDAVTSIRRAFKVRKAGHTGTLDPMATGVMLVCLNEATKIASLIESLDKEYIATAKFGESTDTLDAEGEVTRRASEFKITVDDIQRLLPVFSGEIQQVPPMYSALKVSGQPLYKLARKGIEVERKPRKVTVSTIEVLGFSSPFVTLRVVCSKGTYIRSLCSDIGDMLDAGAHMTGLVRTRVGNFRIEDSAQIGELPQKSSALHTIDSVLRHLPELSVTGEGLKKARNGNPLHLSLMPEFHLFSGSAVRLRDDDGKIFGIGRVTKESIKIERLLFL